MTIKGGDKMPAGAFKTMTRDGPQNLTTDQLFAGKKVVLFSVPGAFTPTCDAKHLPGFVQHFQEFRDKGIEVLCLAVNDPFVMQAWAQSQHAPDGMIMLADGNGDFTRALGLELDASAYGMGTRAKRFALDADDGVVKQLHVEEPGEYRVSSAEYMLQQV